MFDGENMNQKAARHCHRHGEYTSEILRFGRKNQPIYSICPNCKKEMDLEAQNRQRIDRKLKLRQAEINCNIPARYKDAEFDKYEVTNDGQTEAKYVSEIYCTAFSENKKSGCCLIFYGFKGTGKTYLGCAIAKNLIQNGFTVKYSSVLKIAGEIQRTFNRDSDISQNQIIDNYATYDLLILDEIGIQQNSQWELNMLYELINRRYEKTLPSLVIANISKEDVIKGADPETLIDKHLCKHLGSRVVDRLRESEGISFYFNWDSYRSKTYK